MAEVKEKLISIIQNRKKIRANLHPPENGENLHMIDLVNNPLGENRECIQSSDSSQDDFRIRMEHFVATTTAKIDFLSSAVNDLKQHDLSKVFIMTLQDEINTLKAENSELRDKNAIASLAMSDLHTKIKEIECEKSSLITALKILQADSENNRENFIETKITNVHEGKCDDDVICRLKKSEVTNLTMPQSKAVNRNVSGNTSWILGNIAKKVSIRTMSEIARKFVRKVVSRVTCKTI